MVKLEHLDLNKIQDFALSENIKLSKALKNIENNIQTFNLYEPAVVLSVKPLLISVYYLLLDSAMILKYPECLVEKYDLKIGDQLIAFNFYQNEKKKKPNPKLFYGVRYDGVFKDVRTLITKFFLKDDTDLSLIELEEANKELTFSKYYLDILEEKISLYKTFKDEERNGLNILYRGNKNV